MTRRERKRVRHAVTRQWLARQPQRTAAQVSIAQSDSQSQHSFSGCWPRQNSKLTLLRGRGSMWQRQ